MIENIFLFCNYKIKLYLCRVIKDLLCPLYIHKLNANKPTSNNKCQQKQTTQIGKSPPRL